MSDKKVSRKVSSEPGESLKTNTKDASSADVLKATEPPALSSLASSSKSLQLSQRFRDLEVRLAPLIVRFHRGLAGLTTARNNNDIQAFVIAVNELRYSSEGIVKISTTFEKEAFEAYQ